MNPLRFVSACVVLGLVSASTIGLGLPEDSVGASLEYTDVISVDGVPATELYVRAKLWFAEAFVDSKNVLEVEDKEAGILAGKGSIRYEPKVLRSSSLVRGQIAFEAKVMVKDGRYKYSFTNFIHSGSPSSMAGPISFGLITTSSTAPDVRGSTKGWRQDTWSDLQGVSQARAKQLILSLRERMAKPAKGDDDEW